MAQVTFAQFLLTAAHCCSLLLAFCSLFAGEAHDQSIAEQEARVELQARLRDNEARVEELEGAMADEQERSLRTDKTQRALEAAIEELSGWRERASDLDRQLEGVSDRCHQTATAVADQQLGMKALETLVDSLPGGGMVAVAAQDSEPRAMFQPGADWLKDEAETEDARRLSRFVPEVEAARGGGGGGAAGTPSAWAPLSPGGAAKQRGADHLARLQSRLDQAIGSDDVSKVVGVLRDAAVVEADESSLTRPDHTLITSLTALRNHAVALCERGCEAMEALLGSHEDGPEDAVGSTDPGAIEDELAKWEDLANWNSGVGSVWSRLADYHDTLTAQV